MASLVKTEGGVRLQTKTEFLLKGEVKQKREGPIAAREVQNLAWVELAVVAGGVFTLFSR